MATATLPSTDSLFSADLAAPAKRVFKSQAEVLAAIAAGEITDPTEMSKALAPFSVTRVAAQYDSAEDFLLEAENVTLTGDGMSITLKPKHFSTGSYGWNYSGKLAIKIGGKAVRCQGSVNLVVIGSKPE